MALLDFTWALYARAVVKRDAMAGGLYSMALFLIGALVVVGYVEERWTLVPSAAGAFVGTWFGIKLESE